MLIIPYLLEKVAKLFSRAEVVGEKRIENYEEVWKRVKGLLERFKEMGVEKRVVAVADWNTAEFFELIYGITAAGGILYPVNIRLPPDGYFKDEEKMREAYVGGWFRTGDLGVEMPDGGIKVLNRVKDAIKSGGEWIPSSVVRDMPLTSTGKLTNYR